MKRRTFIVAAVLALSAAHAAEVALDVGHGLADPGAISARGRGEFEFNRDFAQALAPALEARGITVRAVNFDGAIGSLAARPQAAAGADFFLSLHHDSVREELLQEWEWNGETLSYSDAHAGFSLYVSRDNPAPEMSGRCASAIGAMLRRAGFVPTRHHFPKRPWADESNAVHVYDNLVVLYRTTLPAVLFEAGVIKHRDEELLLADPARRERMADAVATGVAACLYAGK
ncbi:N-acetylmuramoyl-L-alanine amidase family protein [Azospira restricta]|uniref:N-acetylmuramoyl-L-alanine amidase n=1 Tax=Azospira restricta TaxID=404405 RepID=A0A974Y4C4_9RHOO|nr:N-acetylmuramoyl-L-alanine amidase [Azospira restricta]QRJ64410.1 N-acetylmuramoyl-L-alanine amidase [Azospira restricta]